MERLFSLKVWVKDMGVYHTRERVTHGKIQCF